MTINTNNKECLISKIATNLVIAMALDAGLIGAGNLLGINTDALNIFTGLPPVMLSIVYIITGISGVIMVIGCRCSTCKLNKADGAKE